MDFSVNLPINPVSFGQVSTLLMRGFMSRGVEPPLFHIGNNLDLSCQEVEQNFAQYLHNCAAKSYLHHDRNNPCLKLWHFNGGLEGYSKQHFLFTFYELDQPTNVELNVAKNCDKLFFSNKYSQEVFKSHGVDSQIIPLAFDKYNFHQKVKQYFDDGRIVFNLCGKFEKRKNHKKIIRAWTKKFGNNKKYFLQCTLFNTFLSEDQNRQLFADAVENKSYFNVQFLGFMPKNNLYNDYLNSANIIIGMSGGEGWGLPEFHSVGLGKHSVVLNATGYKEWATAENSVLVEPSNKVEVYDNIFFQKGSPFNQGHIYDFDEDDFISACEEAIKRHESNPINEVGLKIQSDFTVDRMVDRVIEAMK